MKATTGSKSVYYTRGFELISRQEGSAASYYIYDGGLSVRALTNEAGTVTDTLVFDAFGNETAKTGSTDNSYGFQGEEQDETGLYYLRARYMDPSTGTFTSMDTYGGSLSDPMSLHKYMFANSNPVAYCDPGGHEASLQGMVAAMAISGILSAVDSGILYSLQNKDSDIEKYGKSVYGWNVVTAAMNGFLNGFIMGFIGYALCLVLVFRFILSAVGLCIGIPLIASGLDEINSPNGNKALGAYTIAKGVIITIVSTVGLAKSGAEFFNKYGKGGNLIHLEGDPNVEGDGDWGDISKEIDDWVDSNYPSKVELGEFYSSDPSYSPDDFISKHAYKHRFNAFNKSTSSRTQYGPNINVKKLWIDTINKPDVVKYNTEQNTIQYYKDYNFNISTPATPTNGHSVYIPLTHGQSGGHRMIKSSQFPVFRG